MLACMLMPDDHSGMLHVEVADDAQLTIWLDAYFFW